MPQRGVNALTWVGEGPAPEEDEAFHDFVSWVGGRTGADGRAEIRGVRAGEVLVELAPEGGSFGAEPPPPIAQRVTLGRGAHATIELRAR